MADQPCADGLCPPLPTPGSSLCSVHAAFTRRASGSVPIACYACGELIRIGARWIVRSEGAFHARRTCLTAKPADYKIGAVTPTTPTFADLLRVSLVGDVDLPLLAEPLSLLSRVLSRITLDTRVAGGCWRFNGAMSQSGRRGVFYPVIAEGRPSRRIWRVNRLVLVLSQGRDDVRRDVDEPFGDWLSRARRYYAGGDASHEVCDRSECVNPSHLMFDSHANNVNNQRLRRLARAGALTESRPHYEAARVS